MIDIEITEKKTEIQRTKKWMRLTDKECEGQYGYVEADLPETVTTTLLHQQLSYLDLTAVIKAINRIE